VRPSIAGVIGSTTALPDASRSTIRAGTTSGHRRRRQRSERARAAPPASPPIDRLEERNRVVGIDARRGAA